MKKIVTLVELECVDPKCGNKQWTTKVQESSEDPGKMSFRGVVCDECGKTVHHIQDKPKPENATYFAVTIHPTRLQLDMRSYQGEMLTGASIAARLTEQLRFMGFDCEIKERKKSDG